jgi:hypothetical protein
LVVGRITLLHHDLPYLKKFTKKGQDRNKTVTDNNHNAPVGKMIQY